LEISEEDFKLLPNLRSIFMYKNQIKVLSKNLFLNNPLIGEIKLDSNNISTIDGTFDNLKSLIYLYLDKNVCIDVAALGRTDIEKKIPVINQKCKIYTVDDCKADL
jgi:hypothetical protein